MINIERFRCIVWAKLGNQWSLLEVHAFVADEPQIRTHGGRQLYSRTTTRRFPKVCVRVVPRLVTRPWFLCDSTRKTTTTTGAYSAKFVITRRILTCVTVQGMG